MSSPPSTLKLEGQRPDEGKVLIVDDEAAAATLLSRTLQSNGFPPPVVINDPRLALSAFLEHKPDLVVLDLIMPHLDGYTLARQIRSRIPAGTFLPILVLTGDGSRETKRKLLAAGADDFLTKPYDTLEILLRIRRLLETRLFTCGWKPTTKCWTKWSGRGPGS